MRSLPARSLPSVSNTTAGMSTYTESPLQGDERDLEQAGNGHETLSHRPHQLDPKPSEAEIHAALYPPKPRWRRYLSAIRWFLFDQWFLLVLGLLVLIASQVQVPGAHQQKKETVVTYLCVSVIFLITGLTLPTRVLVENYARWKLHLFVQSQSFLMTSATVYAVVSLCATNRNFMDPGLLVGMIFTGCVPTTISSNVVMTRQAHGNQALTVVQSTLGNFLGPFLTPLLIKMYTASGAWYTEILAHTDAGGLGELYRRVFMQLGLSLFLPLVSVAAWFSFEVEASRKLTLGIGGWPDHTELIPQTDEEDFHRLEAQ